ncbi:MAG TPA: hypothetical protein VGI45_18070 [Terracidiphilus sp.]|jgi:hypothetical protein
MYRAAAAIALLSSLTLLAQNRSIGTAGSSTIPAQDQVPPSTIVLEVPFDFIPLCPIGMRARQDVWNHTITIHRGGEQYKGPFSQRIVLTLTNAHPAKIVAATVLVRGFDGKNRTLQTGGAEGTATKILRTGFTVSDNNTVSADLYISGFTAITSVKLQDVTYADGSTWHSDQSNSCRIAPDPMMLIAGH